MTKVETLTFVQIRDFAIVAIAVMGFIVLLGNVIKTIRDWKAPGKSAAAWRKEIDDSMKGNTDRIKKVEDGNRVIMKALIAMMNHEINGNSVDKLQTALGELNEYLINNI